MPMRTAIKHLLGTIAGFKGCYISRQSSFTLQSYTDHTQLTMAYGNRERTCLGSWPLAWPSEWLELCIPLWCPTHWAHCRGILASGIQNYCAKLEHRMLRGCAPKIHQNHLIPAGPTGPTGPTGPRGPNTAGPRVLGSHRRLLPQSWVVRTREHRWKKSLMPCALASTQSPGNCMASSATYSCGYVNVNKTWSGIMCNKHTYTIIQHKLIYVNWYKWCEGTDMPWFSSLFPSVPITDPSIWITETWLKGLATSSCCEMLATPAPTLKAHMHDIRSNSET